MQVLALQTAEVGLGVDGNEKRSWFARAATHPFCEAEQREQNRQESRLQLAHDGWPIPEEPQGGWLTTRWDADALIVRDRIVTAHARQARWLMDRLAFRGQSSGVMYQGNDDGTVDFMLEWRVPLHERRWDESEKQRFRSTQHAVERRIGLLLPLFGISREIKVTPGPLEWAQSNGTWHAYSADRRPIFTLPFRNVQQVWPFEEGWARFSRGVQIWRDGGPHGEDWSEFSGTYHAVRRDGLILEDSFQTLEELDAALAEFK